MSDLELPPDPFIDVNIPNRLLEVAKWGVMIGHKELDPMSGQQVILTVQTVYGDLSFFCSGEDAIALGEQIRVEGEYVVNSRPDKLWVPGQ